MTNTSTNATLQPDFGFPEFNWVSGTIETVIESMNVAGLTLALISNILNIVVFVRLGLAEVMNLCLFALSVSDGISCVIGALAALSNRLSVSELAPAVRPYMDIDNLWEYLLLLVMVTQSISTNVTSLIAVERCLCVVTPFKVKAIVTLTRTQIAICLFVVFGFMVNIPQFLTASIQLVFNPDLNVTRIEIVYTEGRFDATNWCHIFTFLAFDPISVILVIVTCVIMIRGLQRSAKFKRNMKTPGTVAAAPSNDKDTAAGGRPQPQLSANNVRLVKMLLIVAATSTVIHLFSIMTGIIRVISLYNFEFAMTVSRSTYFFLVAVIFQFFYACNMGINTMIYFRYNTKFRNAIIEMMPCLTGDGKKVIDDTD